MKTRLLISVLPFLIFLVRWGFLDEDFFDAIDESIDNAVSEEDEIKLDKVTQIGHNEFNKQELKDLLENSELDQMKERRDFKRKRFNPDFGDKNFFSAGKKRQNRFDPSYNKTDGERSSPPQYGADSGNRRPYRSRDFGDRSENYTQRTYQRDRFGEGGDYRNHTYDRNWGERRQFSDYSNQNYTYRPRFSRGPPRFGDRYSSFRDGPPRYRDRQYRPWSNQEAFGNFPKIDESAFPTSGYRRNNFRHQDQSMMAESEKQQPQGSIFIDKNDQVIQSQAPDFGDQSELEQQPDFIEEEKAELGRYLTEEEDEELRRVLEYNEELETSSFSFVDAEEHLGFKFNGDPFEEKDDVIFDPQKLSK